MHDQKKKVKDVLNPEEEAAAVAEHERVGVLYKGVLNTSKVHDYSMKTLEDTEKLLLAVPEAYTAYNCRRRALEVVWKETEPSTADTAAATSEKDKDAASVPAHTMTQLEWLQKELKLNSKVLLLNYKNYNAFVHRHWVFGQIEALAEAELMQIRQAKGDAVATSEEDAAPPPIGFLTAPAFSLLRQLLQKEQAQCEQLLEMDERNFHAWNHRRWVLAQEYRANSLAHNLLVTSSYHNASVKPDAPGTGAEAADEAHAVAFTADEAAQLAYAKHKIKSNFSNYSAWHQRSLALKSATARWHAQLASLEARSSAEKHQEECRRVLLAQLREDVGFLEHAIYCDPNDQSAWFYATFVLQLLHNGHQTAAEAAEATALADAFMNAVIELIVEVNRVGTEDDCYIPYYFLLDQLTSLHAARDQNSKATVIRYTDVFCRKVLAHAPATNNAEDGQMRCFRVLHERLCKADVLRKGLYDDMLKRATENTA